MPDNKITTEEHIETPDNQENIIIGKQVLPTGLKSDAIRQFWSEKLREQSLFSARTTSRTYLEKVKELLVNYQTALGETQSGEPITQGLQRTRMLMLEKLNELGLVDRDAEGNVVEGKMTNLGSVMRLNLIIKTNTELANSMRMKARSEDPLMQIMYPYYELVRNESRKNPRNWYDRWIDCANAVGWKGVVQGTSRMIAKIDSPIWSQLGHGYTDSLGTDMPPFAFGSGMGWERVTAKEIKDLGLSVGGEENGTTD